MTEVTTAVRVAELDAILAEAAERWRGWRSEHPRMFRDDQALTFTEREALDQRDYGEHSRIVHDVVPEDPAMLYVLAQDERIWDVECEGTANEPSQLVYIAVGYLISYQETEVDRALAAGVPA